MLTPRRSGRAAAALALTALVVVPATGSSAAAPAPAALQEGLQVVQVIRFGGQMFDGMMGGMLRRAGMPEEMEQTLTVNGAGTKQRIDTGDRSTVIDLDGEQVIDLDHKKKKATVTTFEVMRERLRKAAEGMSSLPQMQPQAEEPADVVVTMDMKVESAGAVQHGPFAAEEFHQTISFHSATPEGEDLGTFVLYNVMRVSDAYDRTPLETFGRAYAARLGEMFEGTGGLGAGMAALMGNERFREAIAEAARGFEQMGDRAPVYTHMAMVNVPPGMVFDAAKAFVKPEKKGGGLGGMLGAMTGRGGDAQPPAEQTTTIITESDTRSAGPFAAGDDLFAIPGNYKVEHERD